MNFSELFRQSSQLCKFSPDGKYLASGVDYRLVIRDVETLQIQHLYSCLDAIQYIEWSNDSQFILCGMYKRGLVQVWSIENQDWNCKVDEGSAGLVAVRWSPDGRHVLTTADFHLRITVWSLVTKSVSYIRYPKQCAKGLDFSKGGKYMALAERRDCKDHISIFSCQSWTLVRHFETETDDLAWVEWSPDGRALCVCDSCLEYKVLLYSLDGRCLSRFSAYDLNLGVKAISWSPSSQFLAVGSYDEKGLVVYCNSSGQRLQFVACCDNGQFIIDAHALVVRILNHITWKTVATLNHPQHIDNSGAVIYKESETRAPALPAGLGSAPTVSLFNPQSKYEVQPCPCSIPVTKPAQNKANPKVGISSAAFSHDNKYMMTKNDNMPCALWIWDMRKLTLCAVLIQANPIKCAKWDPCRPRLALCTASNKMYMWSPDGSLSVEVPVEGSFLIHSLIWHPDGESILLVGKEHMCVCFLTVGSDANSIAAHNTSTINVADNTNNTTSSSNKGVPQGGGSSNITINNTSNNINISTTTNKIDKMEKAAKRNVSGVS